MTTNFNPHHIFNNGLGKASDFASKVRTMPLLTYGADGDTTVKGRLAEVLPAIPDNFEEVPFEINGVRNPEKKVILSGGYPVAVVGKKWHLLTHREVIDTALEKIREHGHDVDNSYGRLRVEGHGAKVKLDIVVPDIEFYPADGNPVNGRISLNSGLDGVTGDAVDVDLFRLICLNGAGRSYGEIGRINAVHSYKSIVGARFLDRLTELTANLPKMIEEFNAWATEPLDARTLELMWTPIGSEEKGALSIMDAQLGVGASRGLNEIIERGTFRKAWVPGQNPGGRANTLYDLYNGITYLASHKSEKLSTEKRILDAAREVVDTYLAVKADPEPVLEAIRGEDGTYRVNAA